MRDETTNPPKDADARARASSTLSRELRGLFVLYLVFAAFSALLAVQCVERPAAGSGAEQP